MFSGLLAVAGITVKTYQSKSSFDNSQKAVEYYNQALAVDPNFAQAHAALASAYLYIGLNGFVDPKEVMSKAKAAAERALELDDNLPEATLAMARIKQVAWDWAGAEREYKHAIELNPNLAAAHFRYAFFLSTMERNKEAIDEIKQARELDPLKPHINLDIAYIFYFARQYDSALEQYEIGRELDPDFGPAYYGKGFVYAARGQYLEAINNYKEMNRLTGAHTGVDCYLGFALAKSGQTVEARTMLHKLETGKEYVSPVELAVLHVGLDEPDKALSALERAYLAQDSQLQYIRQSAATVLPKEGDFVLVKPADDKSQWQYAQVTGASGQSAEVKFANGKTRSIKADEYIALN